MGGSKGKGRERIEVEERKGGKGKG